MIECMRKIAVETGVLTVSGYIAEFSSGYGIAVKIKKPLSA
jgi:hypothetical protein